MRNTKSAFTLVELIVVITILAILGTIAFISLQGYSADARNSKRTSDLNNIKEKFVVSVAEGRIKTMDLVDGVTSTIPSVELAGVLSGVAASDYSAGDVNYQLLGIKESDFDDDGKAYVAGATKLAGGAYELAATMESDAGKIAKVTGTYAPRTSASTDWGFDTAGLVFTISDSADLNLLKVNDTVEDSAGNTAKVIEISKDYKTITVDGAGLLNTSVTLALAEDEEDSLIGSEGDLNTPVVNDGAALPY